jgi:iron complex transport system substrate-binding protein
MRFSRTRTRNRFAQAADVGILFALLSSVSAVAAPPKRVIPLMPSLAEIAVAILGDDAAIAGITEYTDFPASLAKKPSVGPYAKPNVETILALKPDLVLAGEDESPKDVLRRLRALGIRVVSVGTESLSKTRASFATIGRVLERPKEAAATLSKFDSAIAAVAERAASRRKANRRETRVLLQVGDDPLIVAGGTSFLHEGLEILGVKNVYGDVKSSFPRIAVEDALRRNPDAILLVALSDDLRTFERAQAKWNGYSSLRAVKEGKVKILRSDALVRPGPRFPEGLIALENALFPSTEKGTR